MADEHATPETPSVPAGDNAQAQATPGPTAASQNRKSFSEAAAEAGKAALDASRGAKGYFETWFPGHANEVFFALVGLVVAIICLIIGFWRTLVLLLFMLAGVAYGQYVDGDPKIWNRLKEIFQSSDEK